MSPNTRLLLAICALTLITLLGTAAYVILEGWSFSDALYMTVITITTVGFGEVRELSGAGRALMTARPAGRRRSRDATSWPSSLARRHAIGVSSRRGERKMAGNKLAGLLIAALCVAAHGQDGALVDLEGSMEPFVEHFNEAAGFSRFVTVLSPT